MIKKDEKFYNDLRKHYCYVLFECRTIGELDKTFNLIRNYLQKGRVFKVPYDDITQFIYYSDDDITKLKELSSDIQEDLNPFLDDYTETIIKDTISHINLAISQKEYIDEILYDSRHELNSISEQYSDVNDIKSKIYTDFITILGIFTAITFATFGGLQLLGEVFGKIQDNSLKSIGGAIILGSVYIFSIYLILVVLLTGIKKLTNVTNDKSQNYNFSLLICALLIVSCLIIAFIGFKIYNVKQ